MRSILTVPAWRLFLVFIVGVFMSETAASYTANYFNWDPDYGPYPTLRYSLITLVLWSYPYLVGRALRRLAGKQSCDRKFLAVILIAVVNNVFSVYYTESSGVFWPVIIITALINVYCTLSIFSFPARELKSIELGRRAYFHEIWKELLQFILWPISVWWFQPRLAALVNTAATKKSPG